MEKYRSKICYDKLAALSSVIFWRVNNFMCCNYIIHDVINKMENKKMHKYFMRKIEKYGNDSRNINSQRSYIRICHRRLVIYFITLPRSCMFSNIFTANMQKLGVVSQISDTLSKVVMGNLFRFYEFSDSLYKNHKFLLYFFYQ